jgi:hypothetical protein
LLFQLIDGLLYLCRSGATGKTLVQINSEAESMNVFLVDDSIIIRERLKRLLAIMEEVKVIGEARAFHETMDAILKQKPDVVLLESLVQRGRLQYAGTTKEGQSGSGGDCLDRRSVSAVPPKVSRSWSRFLFRQIDRIRSGCSRVEATDSVGK